MTGKRGHSVQRRGDGPAARKADPRKAAAPPRRQSAPTTDAGVILQLQALAGNQAVGNLIEAGGAEPQLATDRQAPSRRSAPIPVAQRAKPVSEMTSTEKLVEAYRRANISAAVRQKLESVLTPEALVAAIITFAAVFVASQFTPVGWAADLAIALTIVFVGSALYTAIEHLVNFAAARNATTSEELDRAGEEFAAAIAEIEVDTVILLLTRGIGGRTGGGRPLDGPPPAGGLVLATSGAGRVVPVLAATVPARVAAEVGLQTGVLMMSGNRREDRPARPAGGRPEREGTGGSPEQEPGGTGYAAMTLAQLRRLAPTDREAAWELIRRYEQMDEAALRRLAREGDQTAAATLRTRIPSNEEDLRRALGSNYRPPHTAFGVYRDATGRTTWSEWLSSGNMTEAERALPFPRNMLATHTEIRALAQAPLARGGELTITGQYDPCGACQAAMREAAQRTGATIKYWWPGGQMTFR